MSHTDLLKRAFAITWRYRPLWVFGFFLALCSGGSGGGNGGGNFNFNVSGGDFGQPGDIPTTPDIDLTFMIAVGAGLCCLVILLIIVSIVVRAVTRTALIRMVRQITETEAVTVREGLRLGWSRRAWRVFLVSLVIGIPLFVISVTLVLVAFSPLLLLITGETAFMVTGVAATIGAFLCVFLLLLVIGQLIWPIQELTWRQAVVEDKAVFTSFGDTFTLIKHNLKAVFVLWLLMFGIAIGWFFVALLVVLPVALIAALIIGGTPALLVYLFTSSWIGAAVAGGPLALVVLVVIVSFGSGLYVTFQSAVWTLAHLEWTRVDGPPPAESDETLIAPSPSEA